MGEKLVIKDIKDNKKKEDEMKLHIFNSSELVPTDFMVHKNKKSEQTAENDVNDPVTTSASAAAATTKTTPAANMVPTPLPSEDKDFKSRRRNLFRNHDGKLKKGSLLSKFKKLDRSRFRKLLRNHKPGSSSDQNIIIEEKKNPRKIIFRKNLIRGERRRVPASLNNDPLVKSLQRQIKSQKSKLFSNRKRPFTKLETTSPQPEKTTTSEDSVAKKTTELDKSNNNLIEQMEKMEIMRQESEEMSSTTPVTPLSDFVTTSETLEDDLEGVTDPNEDLETTTVIATSISTSEAFSYYSSAPLPKD